MNAKEIKTAGKSELFARLRQLQKKFESAQDGKTLLDAVAEHSFIWKELKERNIDSKEILWALCDTPRA